MSNSIERLEAVEKFVQSTLAAMGEELKHPFEIHVHFEFIDMGDYSDDELCPVVKIIKR